MNSKQEEISEPPRCAVQRGGSEQQRKVLVCKI